MLGAIIGDTIGSVYEWGNVKSTNFPLFTKFTRPTDDSVMTMAVAEWLLIDPNHTHKALEKCMVKWGKRYPHAGYGGAFYTWLFNPVALYGYRDIHTRNSNEQDELYNGSERHPYNSWGNGSAMRCSACGWVANSLEEALDLSKRSAEITHNHPEGIKGAQATVAAIFMAKQGATKEDIKQYIEQTFGYDLSKDCDEIRPSYYFDVSCQGTLPAALAAFLDSSDFESAIRLAVSLGGDSDTIACITGGIAQAFYKDIPIHIVGKMHELLDEDWWEIIHKIDSYPQTIRIKKTYNLDRFIIAQEHTYPIALKEIIQGQKQSHWIWYIFPQMRGLGQSEMSEYYGIASKDEAEAYFVNQTLRERLLEISEALLLHVGEKTIWEILGTTDAIKVRSCMTLFDAICPDDIYAEVLHDFYDDVRCEKTLELLS